MPPTEAGADWETETARGCWSVVLCLLLLHQTTIHRDGKLGQPKNHNESQWNYTWCDSDVSYSP